MKIERIRGIDAAVLDALFRTVAEQIRLDHPEAVIPYRPGSYAPNNGKSPNDLGLGVTERIEGRPDKRRIEYTEWKVVDSFPDSGCTHVAQRRTKTTHYEGKGHETKRLAVAFRPKPGAKLIFEVEGPIVKVNPQVETKWSRKKTETRTRTYGVCR